MWYVLITLGVIVGLVVLAFVLLMVNLILASRRQHKALAARLAPALAPLDAGGAPDPGAVQALAEDPETRSALYEALAERGQESAFPAAWRTQEALAESDLVRWLSHPNELRGAPGEIQLSEVVTVPTDEVGPVRWFLFRFRTRPPHWAAGKGWMAGGVGPYLAKPDAPLVPRSPAPWSELEAFDAKTPEEHVQAIHLAGVNRGALDSLKTHPHPAPAST
jgi:hypothetical protein